MRIRFGEIYIFIGAFVILTALMYGINANNIMVDYQSYFIGGLITLSGVNRNMIEDVEDRINKLEAHK